MVKGAPDGKRHAVRGVPLRGVVCTAAQQAEQHPPTPHKHLSCIFLPLATAHAQRSRMPPHAAVACPSADGFLAALGPVEEVEDEAGAGLAAAAGERAQAGAQVVQGCA